MNKKKNQLIAKKKRVQFVYSFRLIFFFFVVSYVTSTPLRAQQQSMGLGQRRSHGLGWNSQGRSQYGGQIHQNQMALQQQQQDGWQSSSVNQMSQSLHQRGSWDAASRSSYQQQMQQNHQLLQQLQQSRWGHSTQPQVQNGEASSSEEGLGGGQQQKRKSYQQHQRGSWNATTRSNYQQQIQQNHEALQQQQQARWEERGSQL